MFDLIAGKTNHAPRHQTVPILMSIVAHATLVGAVFVGTLLFVAAPVPQMDMIMAFVAPPSPPPSPPPPAPVPPKGAPRAETPVPRASNVAPVEPPREIAPEPPRQELDEEDVVGVEGGVPGGIPGGVLGDLLPEIPPAPPPPPPESRKPVRIGGEIKAPTLVHRVEPEYPAAALVSQLQGVVILEAIVDQEGRVESVRVLRSPGVFDKAALEAVRQWRYSPVLLDGRPVKFILTVVVSFRLQ